MIILSIIILVTMFIFGYIAGLMNQKTKIYKILKESYKFSGKLFDTLLEFDPKSVERISRRSYINGRIEAIDTIMQKLK